MTRTRFIPKIALLAAIIGGSVALFSKSASASDWRVAVGVGNTPCAGYASAGIWVPPHYEVRNEQVLISRAHRERQLIRGYWSEVYVPAYYETRAVNVLVPGYYQSGPGIDGYVRLRGHDGFRFWEPRDYRRDRH